MNEQLSLLPDLDKASDTRKANLCRTWKNSLKNDCGVFIENRMDFEAHEGKRIYPYIRICCALKYPWVFYDFDVQDMTKGKGSPCDELSPRFDVHECAPNVMLMVEQHLRDYVKGYGVTEKLIQNVLKQMEKSINDR